MTKVIKKSNLQLLMNKKNREIIIPIAGNIALFMLITIPEVFLSKNSVIRSIDIEYEYATIPDINAVIAICKGPIEKKKLN